MQLIFSGLPSKKGQIRKGTEGHWRDAGIPRVSCSPVSQKPETGNLEGQCVASGDLLQLSHCSSWECLCLAMPLTLTLSEAGTT